MITVLSTHAFCPEHGRASGKIVGMSAPPSRWPSRRPHGAPDRFAEGRLPRRRSFLSGLVLVSRCKLDDDDSIFARDRRVGRFDASSPCVVRVQSPIERGAPAQIKVYADAFHDFDWPGDKLHSVTSQSGRAVHYGENDDARADALARVPTFL